MFDGPKLKVKRAKKHISELIDVVAAYVNSDFCECVIQRNRDTGIHELVIKVVKQTPCEIPLIIGDAVHNLRSALDILICDVVRNSGNTPTKHTKFPFRETRQELIDAINGGLVKTVGDILVTAIVDSVSPYRQ